MVANHPTAWHAPDRKHLSLAAGALTLTLLMTFSIVPISTGSGYVQGSVLDQQGTPLQYATVVAREVIRGEMAIAEVRADGTYSFTGVRPGTYMLWASDYGYKTMPLGRITLRAGERVRKEVVLAR